MAVPEGAWGKISYPPVPPQIITNVFKLDQIRQFQHKDGKNSKFLRASRAFFHFPPKIFSYTPLANMMLVPLLGTGF